MYYGIFFRKTLELSLVLVLVGIFSACQKKDGEQITNNVISESSNETKQLDVEELISKTGIDIYELSELEGIQEITIKQRMIINAFMKVSELHERGAITEDKLTQIQNLTTQMQILYEDGNDYEVLRLYEQLCSVLISIDGFVFDVNEQGLQTFTYSQDKPNLQLPIAQMYKEQNNAELLICEIEETNPNFSSLPETTKIEVMAAAIYVNMSNNEVVSKAAVSQTLRCEQVNNDYAVNMAIATATFEAALLGWAATVVAAMPCVAIASASYAASAAWVTYVWKRDSKNCE